MPRHRHESPLRPRLLAVLLALAPLSGCADLEEVTVLEGTYLLRGSCALTIDQTLGFANCERTSSSNELGFVDEGRRLIDGGGDASGVVDAEEMLERLEIELDIDRDPQRSWFVSGRLVYERVYDRYRGNGPSCTTTITGLATMLEHVPGARGPLAPLAGKWRTEYEIVDRCSDRTASVTRSGTIDAVIDGDTATVGELFVTADTEGVTVDGERFWRVPED